MKAHVHGRELIAVGSLLIIRGVVALVSREGPIHSSEEAALLPSILTVIASNVTTIAPTANAASHNGGGSSHRRGARDRPAP